MPLIVFQYWALTHNCAKHFLHYLCKNIKFSPGRGANSKSFSVTFVYLFSHYHWATASLKKCEDFATISFSILGSKPNCAKHFLQKYYVSPFRGANSESFTVSFVYFLSPYHWATAAYQQNTDYATHSFSILGTYTQLCKTLFALFMQNIMFPQAMEKTQSPLLFLLFICSRIIIGLQRVPRNVMILIFLVFQYWPLNPIVQNTFCKNIMFTQAGEQTRSPLLFLLFIFSHYHWATAAPQQRFCH